MQDDQLDSPRDWGHVGTIVCFHRRYNLSDKGHGFGSPEELKDYLENSGDVGLWMPIYGYDHGGLTISTSPFHCPWDSGQLGVFYLTNKELAEEFKNDEEAARKFIIGQVAVYDQYIRGAVYFVAVEKISYCETCGQEVAEDVESCGGIYADDIEEEYRELMGFEPEEGAEVEVVREC